MRRNNKHEFIVVETFVGTARRQRERYIWGWRLVQQLYNSRCLEAQPSMATTTVTLDVDMSARMRSVRLCSGYNLRIYRWHIVQGLVSSPFRANLHQENHASAPHRRHPPPSPFPPLKICITVGLGWHRRCKTLCVYWGWRWLATAK